MIWKHEVDGLNNLPTSRKISISIFLVVTGIGYLFGFFNILLTYQMNDQEPGLSVADVRIAFYGARDKTSFEKSIDGSMKGYFSSDSDYNAVKMWLANGFKEADYATVQPIITASCTACHSSAAQVADVVVETYEDVEGFLVQDTGKSYSRLVGISHTHILAIAAIVFILVSIMCGTTYSTRLKVILCVWSYFAIVFDVGAWWLAKASPNMAILVIIGGASLGTVWGLLIVLPLIEMWFKKRSTTTAVETAE